MYYLLDSIEKEIVIDKSRFICQLHPVNSLEEIEEILASTRKKHREANHNCYAYIFDRKRLMKASDDGEPQKTAGIPMLEVLKHHDLTDVLVIVTRYFGGVKLGAGGLVRAYTNAVTNALSFGQIAIKHQRQVYELTISYGFYDTFLYQTRDKVTLLDQIFAENITVRLYFNASSMDELNDYFNGKLEYIEKEIIEVLDPLK